MASQLLESKISNGNGGINIDDIIDINKTGFKLETSYHKYGYAFQGLCCADSGACGVGKRVNFLLVKCWNKVAELLGLKMNYS